jgi:hypothetical protein
MLFRQYKKCSSFSGSRDHTSKPGGGLLIGPALSSQILHMETDCPQRKWKVAKPSSL